MHKEKRIVCPENEEIVSYMLQKRQELTDKPKGLSDNLDMTLSKAYDGICASKIPIRSLKDLSQIKGIGKWILKLMQGFFDTGSELEDLTNKVKEKKAPRRYLPQRNSAAYALLITLYKGTSNGNEFMLKQQLIDAAEASGLSRAPFLPDKGKGKPLQFGSSPRDWYTGWNCMKTLIAKGLIVKSSCPAKYMLTEEGKEAARECLMRSRLSDPGEDSGTVEGLSDVDMSNPPDIQCTGLAGAVASSSIGGRRQKKQIDVPPESLQRLLCMGYSKEKVLHAFTEVSETSQIKDVTSLWPAVLCRLREDEVHGLHSETQSSSRDCQPTTVADPYRNGQVDLASHQGVVDLTSEGRKKSNSHLICSTRDPFSSGVYSSSSRYNDKGAKLNTLRRPPLSLGERFEDVYEVILALDDREQFAVRGSKGSKLIDNICKEHKVNIMVRRLPVGDGLWIARHKYLHTEYVLDFIVERKKVDDLRSSIRDHRYKDQKLRLLRCGLKKLIYLVEGDPNFCEASESVKTASFTTEILEGFDVQRTSCLRDTLKKYAYLTHSITQYYCSELPIDEPLRKEACLPFDKFIKKCQDLEKMTVSDVFAVQLMQVPQVTEEIAVVVLDLYPTLLSLARAYLLLDGDLGAQEEMLSKQSNNAISAAASRNIFQLVWSDDHQSPKS